MQQIIEGDVNLNAYADFTDSNLKHVEPTEICSDVYEVTQSIILSSMAAKADKIELELEELGNNKLLGDQMLQYFKK